MPSERERYVGVVPLPREPRDERRRRILRIFTVALTALIVWLLLYRVISPPPDSPRFPRGGVDTSVELPR